MLKLLTLVRSILCPKNDWDGTLGLSKITMVLVLEFNAFSVFVCAIENFHSPLSPIMNNCLELSTIFSKDYIELHNTRRIAAIILIECWPLILLNEITH